MAQSKGCYASLIGVFLDGANLGTPWGSWQGASLTTWSHLTRNPYPHFGRREYGGWLSAPPDEETEAQRAGTGLSSRLAATSPGLLDSLASECSMCSGV